MVSKRKQQWVEVSAEVVWVEVVEEAVVAMVGITDKWLYFCIKSLTKYHKKYQNILIIM